MEENGKGTLFDQSFSKLNDDGKRYVFTVLQSLEFAQKVMLKHRTGQAGERQAG